MKVIFEENYSGREIILETKSISAVFENPQKEVVIMLHGSPASFFVKGKYKDIKKQVMEWA